MNRHESNDVDFPSLSKNEAMDSTFWWQTRLQHRSEAEAKDCSLRYSLTKVSSMDSVASSVNLLRNSTKNPWQSEKWEISARLQPPCRTQDNHSHQDRWCLPNLWEKETIATCCSPLLSCFAWLLVQLSFAESVFRHQASIIWRRNRYTLCRRHSHKSLL